MSHSCTHGDRSSSPTSGSTTAVTADVVCELSPVQSGRPHDAVLRVEERLLRYGALYEERLREAQRRKILSEAAALEEAVRPPPPKLRRPFAPSPSFHTSAEAARQHRAERQAALLAEKATASTCQPAILPLSREMAVAERKRNDWMRLSVGDVLMERHKRMERHLERKRQEKVASFSFKPDISPRARSTKSTRPVVERLYRSAGSATTGTATFGDVTNLSTLSGTKPKAASAATYQRLYKDAVTRRAHEQTQEKRAHMPSRNEFNPRIDAVSGLIASQRGDTTHERLLRPKSVPDAARHVRPEETFAPCINSSLRLKRAPLSARTAVWQRRRAERLHHALVERGEAEMRECTFQPRTRQGPPALSKSRAREPSGGCMSPFASIISSAEDLLSRVNLETSAPPPERDCCARLLRDGGDLLDAIPSDIVAALEEAEYITKSLCRLPTTHIDLHLSPRTSL
ncbi:hypothetical protein GH5_07755 [Leishmania sp. Ghana 2012 LV757]|uniref:hypothetical protein n=1 Tax=Leishmania sp. Ghana 2012 LV757 TaxID=2803181 RepID=UPI001B63203A|nr:hypothetical protein GH5_07755 [Leishmania sp. Ghana 2012 LV757]